jgi:hypothetical protein
VYSHRAFHREASELRRRLGMEIACGVCLWEATILTQRRMGASLSITILLTSVISVPTHPLGRAA